MWSRKTFCSTISGSGGADGGNHAHCGPAWETVDVTLLLSFVVMLIAVLGLSLGVLLGRRPIQGSCGGIGGRCGACSRGCREQRAEGEFEQQRD